MLGPPARRAGSFDPGRRGALEFLLTTAAVALAVAGVVSGSRRSESWVDRLLSTRFQPGKHAAGWLSTKGGSIVDDEGHTVVLRALNWYGLETRDRVLGGLDQRSMAEICDTMVELGFNAIRVPLAMWNMLDTTPLTQFLEHEPDLVGKRPLDVLTALVKTAAEHGLYIVLDNHRREAGFGPEPTGLWHDPTNPRSETDVARYLQALARFFARNRNVVAIDIFNEPKGPARWSDDWDVGWPAAAERLGEAVLTGNPNLLVMVQGVQVGPDNVSYDGGSSDGYWPGGNLSGARTRPVRLRVDGHEVGDKLVYSCHAYGWSGGEVTNPGNFDQIVHRCRQVFDEMWAFVPEKLQTPLFCGEFGGETELLTNSQVSDDPMTHRGAWLTAMLQTLHDTGASWAWWAANGTGMEDNRGQRESYGFLAANWREAASEKLRLLFDHWLDLRPHTRGAAVKAAGRQDDRRQPADRPPSAHRRETPVASR